MSGLKIYNNTLTNSSGGIFVDTGTVDANITHNVVENMSTTGIISFGVKRTLIYSNNVNNTTIHGIDVRNGFGNDTTISNNIIKVDSEGIYVMHSTGHKILNNTIYNTALSSITDYGAGNVTISGNKMIDGFVGILLSSGFYNVTLENNNFTGLKSTPFPPTFSYPLLVGDSYYNSVAKANGTFSDSSYSRALVTITSKIFKNTIINRETLTYTIKVFNNGNTFANNIILSDFCPNETIIRSITVSRGTYSNGVWNLDSLPAQVMHY